MAFVFGYLSLLRSDSVRSAVSNSGVSSVFIPAKIHGYVRSWASFRKSGIEEIKNYVTSVGFKVASYHAWATLKEHNGAVNGICFQVNEADLVNLDAREIGYQRVEVTDRVSVYDGFSLRGERVFTYIAPVLDVSNLGSVPWISADYVNMGFEGALAMEQCLPGFYRDYVESTLPCESLVKDMRQVFWSYDGSRLYLLDEKDSSVVLIHDFGRVIHKPRSDCDIHYSALISKNEAHKDSRFVDKSQSGIYFEALSTLSSDRINTLIESSDPWVHIYLSKNLNMTDEQKVLLCSKNNFVVDIIMEYLR